MGRDSPLGYTSTWLNYGLPVSKQPGIKKMQPCQYKKEQIEHLCRAPRSVTCREDSWIPLGIVPQQWAIQIAGQVAASPSCNSISAGECVPQDVVIIFWPEQTTEGEFITLFFAWSLWCVSGIHTTLMIKFRSSSNARRKDLKEAEYK